MDLKLLSDSLSNLVATCIPSVVTVSGVASGTGATAYGSGWACNEGGYIATNYHVVSCLTGPIALMTANGQTLAGDIVGIDPENDLALLRSSSLEIPSLPIRLNPAVLGELCVAIGSPLGLRQTASLGIVSGVSRQQRHPSGFVIEEMLQTDASINPGNSGGPLVDSEGNVLGINTMGMGETVNFSVSSETISHVIEELINYGDIKRASLGVQIASVRKFSAGILKDAIQVQDVLDPGCPLMAGDYILKINSSVITRRIDVRRALARSSINKPVIIDVERDGTVRTVRDVALVREIPRI